MQVRIEPSPLRDSDADLACLALGKDDPLPDWLAGLPGAGDVRSSRGKLTMLRPDSTSRVLVVGLGDGREDAEVLREAAAAAVRQARRYAADSIAWQLPRGTPGVARALTEGTILAAWSFDRFKEEREDDEGAGPGSLILHGGALESLGEEVEEARTAALAANRARDLQTLPANIADPAYLAARAEQIAAASPRLELEVLGPERQRELGMGGLLAVGAGSAKETLLIVLRYAGGGRAGTLGVVGKAVTFDTGGISLKPAQSMPEMKMDMSGGAAALEATAAIAELGLPIELLTVVPAVENMPDGAATRPGDVITQLNGTTVEINTTDAEGRLILADALTWCAREGADRMVDLATLTGAALVALGSTHAALVATDDELAEAIAAAGREVGELTWRLPLHREYRDLMRGKIADLVNSAPKRKAGTITAASFLEEFVEDLPWAHLDIAGTSWDVGRAYVGTGATGFGVRLLVRLARLLADAGGDAQ